MLETIINFVSDFVNGYIVHISSPELSVDWIGMTIALPLWAFCIVMFYGTLVYLIISGTTNYMKRPVLAARSFIVEKYSSLVSSK